MTAATPEIWALRITEFHDDYKLRGNMPSETKTWYFDDVAKAYCKLHLWFRDTVMENMDFNEDDEESGAIAKEIEKRCKEEIDGFEMKDWCFSNGVPLDECPDLDTFLRAVFPAEFVPVKFQVKLKQIKLTELDIVKDDVPGLAYIITTDAAATKKKKRAKIQNPSTEQQRAPPQQ